MSSFPIHNFNLNKLQSFHSKSFGIDPGSPHQFSNKPTSLRLCFWQRSMPWCISVASSTFDKRCQLNFRSRFEP